MEGKPIKFTIPVIKVCACQSGKKSCLPSPFINVMNMLGWAQLDDSSGMRYYRLVSVRSFMQLQSAGYEAGAGCFMMVMYEELYEEANWGLSPPYLSSSIRVI